MKKKKREHIYSDSLKNGIDITINNKYTQDLHNPMRQLQALYQIRSNAWTEYVSFIMYDKHEPVRKDKWEDISYLLNEINDPKLVPKIINTIMENDDLFDPFEDLFPYYYFDKNLSARIKKKSEFIKKYCNTQDVFVYKNLNVVFIYNNTRINLPLFFEFFDIVVMFNSYSTIFAISKDLKKSLDLNKLKEELNNIEEDVWETNNSQTTLYVKNDKKSKIHFYENKDLLLDALSTFVDKDFEDRTKERTAKLQELYDTLCKYDDEEE